jgi:GAF domain-containing protein
MKAFLAPPVFPDDEDKSRIASLLNIILLGLLCFMGVIVLTTLFTNPAPGSLLVNSTTLTIAIFLYYLFRRGHVFLVSTLTITIFWSVLAFLTFFGGGLTLSIVTSYFVILVMAAALLGQTATILVAAASLVVWTIVGILQINGQLPESITPYNLATDIGGTFGSLIICALILYLTVRNLNQSLANERESNQRLYVYQSQLEERVRSRTHILALAAEIGRDLSQVRDVEDLLRGAANSIYKGFGLYHVQIYLVDASGQNLVLRAGTGSVGQELRSRGHSLPLNAASTNGAAAINRQAVIVADTALSLTFRPNPLLPETRSEMAVPLIASDMVVGVLDLQSAQPHAFSTDNLGAFEILAGQLAIAIENARLIRDTSQARTELEARVRQSARTDWNQYLDAIRHGERIGFVYNAGALSPISESIMEYGRAQTVPIKLAGEEIGTIALEETVAELSAADREMMNAIARQVSQQIENLRLLEEAERYRREAEEAAHRLIREGWADVWQAGKDMGFVYDQTAVQPLPDMPDMAADVVVPLAVQGEVIGQLELAGIAADDAETKELVTAVAARLSAHLENLRLTVQTEEALSEARQRTAELNILNEMEVAFAAARETDEMLALIHTYASRLIRPTENLYIALYDEAQDEIVIYLYYKPGEIVMSDKVENIIRRRSGNGVTEYVMRTRKPLLINGDMTAVAAEMGFDAIGARSQSWMGAPLVVGDHVLGVVALQSFSTPHLYGEYQLELLTAIASGAAIALENIHLLQQVQSRARQEQILREVTARVYTAVDAESILRTAAQELNLHLGLETFIYLEEQTEPDIVAANGGNGHH